jgi:hypothetical protein
LDIPPIRLPEFPASAVPPRTVPSMRFAVRTALESLLNSVDFLKLLAPAPDGQISWDEFKNKVRAFYMFEYVDSVLNLSANPDLSLLQLIAQAAHLGPHFCVWATEGLGHYYTELVLTRGVFPAALLNAAEVSGVPSMSLVPLHTGMGLSLAQAVLNAMDHADPASYGAWLETFLQLCRGNSRAGFANMAYEALGLVACNLHSALVAHIDRYLCQTNPSLLAYFWHGTGRAIYFSPTNFLPFRNAPWQGLERCRQEPPHDLGKRNAVAGFAWALTLVNIRQPEIMATFLKHHEQQISKNDWFRNGLCSALTIWRDAAPQDPHLEEFHRYQPSFGSAPAWNRYVKPCCDWVVQNYPSLKARAQLSEMFQYQKLS